MDQLAATMARLAEEQQQLEESRWVRCEDGPWAQRCGPITPAFFYWKVKVRLGRLSDALRAVRGTREVEEVLLSDLILTGRLRTRMDIGDLEVVLEVSTMVDKADVERAQRATTLLRQARYPAVGLGGGRGERRVGSGLAARRPCRWVAAALDRMRGGAGRPAGKDIEDSTAIVGGGRLSPIRDQIRTGPDRVLH